MRSSIHLHAFALAFAGLVSASPDAAFLEKHCFECHDDVSAKGYLNLLDLEFDPGDPENFAQWVQVFDRVDAGEMPPADEPRPAAADAEKFLADLNPPLIEADETRIAELGRGRVRRLNRAEFETALEDLLGMPLHIQGELPGGREESRFRHRRRGAERVGRADGGLPQCTRPSLRPGDDSLS